MLSHDELLSAIPNVLRSVNLTGFGPKTSGKVRDMYMHEGKRILVTTDRISAFDSILGHIPYKGQVLNQLSAWWFGQMQAIVSNHLVATPDPNVTIAREARALPIEVVVRGYITGVTSTSLWTLYSQGERTPYGIPLPDGLQKYDALPEPIVTPTTKATEGHDERITSDEIVSRGVIAANIWHEVQEKAVAVFKRGQELAQKAGLILVDTKYEFGLIDNEVALIDEIHTPDSSRYWIAETYKPGEEPENFDKEFLRKWFAKKGYRGEGTPPTMPGEFIAQVAARYITAYEKLTGSTFVPGESPAEARIQHNLSAYWQT